MSKLKFNREYYGKYQTSKINISNAYFKMHEDCEILEINDTNYDYKKVVVKLSPEKVDIMKSYEKEVNDYLEDNDIPIVTIVYGNRIYQKVKWSFPIDQIKTIKLKGVFVNNQKKSFPQLWLDF